MSWVAESQKFQAQVQQFKLYGILKSNKSRLFDRSFNKGICCNDKATLF